MSNQSHHFTSSDGQLYLREHVKNIIIPSNKLGIPSQIIPRFTNLRCLPDGSILPRIRMSKKDRLKLKRALCPPSFSPSSSATSA